MEIENEDNESAKHEQDELIKEAKDRFKQAEEYWGDNYKAAIEDMEFRAGDQWPESIKSIRAKENRPCLVVDKCNQYVRQVVNDSRQNRQSIKVRPVDDYADGEVAEVFQGIIRHILERSNADTAFDAAIENAAVGGFGYFRVLTEYAHPGTFNQDIVVKRIRNPLAVYLDPNSKEADFSDAKWGFFVDEISEEEFKESYPDAESKDWENNKEKLGDCANGDTRRICEYFYVEEEDVQYHLLDDGTTVDDETYQRAVNSGHPVPPIVDSRYLKSNKVKWCRLSGAEILEERDWLGKYIPIIPVFGNEYDIDGKVTYSGLIRSMKDPARLYNYSRSAFAERVALTPKAPYIAAAGQVENYPEWEDANSGNYSVLRYEAVDINGVPVPPPQRQSASDIPAGFAQDMQLAEHDIQGAIGMYAASLGQASNEKSGKAILARQREGDIGTFHYHDNLSRAIRHLGRILVDLIPKVYDSSRVVRILGEDGKSDSAQINPQLDAAVKKISPSKSIYNLNVGVYDVVVSSGASYTTKRQEAAEAMMQMTQANPALFNLIGDLMVRSMDWPQADEIADRLKLMLPPQLQQNEEEQPIPPQVQQAIQQAQEHIQMQEQAIQDLQGQLQEASSEQQAKIIELGIKERELAVKEQELIIKGYQAETDRLAKLPPLDPKGIRLIVQQTVNDMMTPEPLFAEPEQAVEQFEMPVEQVGMPVEAMPEQLG